MYREILLLCLVGLSYGLPKPRLSPFQLPLTGKIIGGVETTIEDIPYQIVLLSNGGYICGGSIVSERVISTAAHCTVSGAASSYSIRAGSTTYNSGGVVIVASQVINHPSYNFNGDYDYSLLILSSSLTFGSGIAPVALPVSNQDVPTGSLAQTSGWGVTELGGTSITLRKVIIPIVDQTVCANAYASLGGRPVTDRMICAGLYEEGGKDACQGDSGGPLVVDDVLVGVTSWGRGCALAGFPGVWARVPTVVDWINEYIANN